MRLRIRNVLASGLAFVAMVAGPMAFAPSAQAATYPAGWSDYASTTNTVDLPAYKVVVTLQLFRTAASNDFYNTINAVQTRCAIRKLASTTGVQIDSCRLGIVGGALLRSAGPFYDGGTCCANGTSGFRYIDNNGSLSLLGRVTISYRLGGVLRSDTWDADSSGAFWRLTTG